jgi:alpha-L-rhamnosidase
MACSFSSNHYFDNVHPWCRAQHWLKTAVQAFNARSELINLASLQGSVLLSFVAFTEGDSAQEALLASQAICMIQLMRLPINLSSDPIQREVEIRGKQYSCATGAPGAYYNVQFSGKCG